MKSTQETLERVIYNERKVEQNHGILLDAAKAELAEAKEELNRAKENAIQSWLDSKPLIDELEKQKTKLAKAHQSLNPSNSAITDLESQLEITQKCIKFRKEDQLKTQREIHKINHALDQTRNDMERLKLNIKKEKQTRAKLRQTLHLKRQTIQTLQLTIHAMLLELDAVEESMTKAFQQINHSDSTAVVQLTQEKYYALKRRAEKRISHANRCVSVSVEQKHEVEATHELALSRLNQFYSSRSWSVNRRNVIGQLYTERDAKIQGTIVEEEVTTNIKSGSPKAHAKSLVKSEGGKPQHSRRSASNNIKTTKKSSFLDKMRNCLKQKIRKISG